MFKKHTKRTNAEGNPRDRKTQETEELLKTVENFDFSRASPYVADLMRRLYKIRAGCGLVEDEKERKERESAERKAFKRMDSFEKKKVEIMGVISSTEQLLLRRDEGNKREINQIRRNLSVLPLMLKDLISLQEVAVKGGGIWSSFGGRCPPDILPQRQTDIENIRLHIETLEKINRRYILEGRGIKKFSAERYKTVNLESVDSLKSLTEEELKKLPTVDISEGLEQIEKNKNLLNQHLDIIERQVTEMGEIARECNSELVVQFKMIGRIESDVDRYESQLKGLNQRMLDVTKKAGGVTRLMCLCCAFIMFMFVILTIFLVLQYYIFP